MTSTAKNEVASFTLTLPADVKADQVVRWLAAVSGTIRTGPRRLLGVRALVFEVGATERGISYRLVVPDETADFVVGQLRTLLPSSTATPAGVDDSRHPWMAALEFGQADPRRSLGTMNAEAMSASLLACLQGLRRSEALVLQWVVSPALRQRLPEGRGEGWSHGSSPFGRLLENGPTKDAVLDIRAKLSEPNFLGVLRVAAAAGSKERADHLIARVRASLRSTGTEANRFKKRLVSSKRVIQRITEASTPTVFPAQLTASELAALLAWPIGSPHVVGLPPARSRQLPATGAIPRTGRVIARSNFPGDERLIALSARESTKHLQVVGPTGSGKTALLANLIAQDMQAGRGVVLVESKGDLFNMAVERVPEHRLQDVVLLDVTDTAYPVGFNILQGNPYAVAADIQRLFDHLYPQDARGVRVRQAFYHLILTLMTSTGASEPMTFADIGPLAVPREDQKEFARRLVAGVSHVEELAAWWHGLTDDRTRAMNLQPLMDRIWQLNNRPSIRNIIGQSKSTIDLVDIIRQKKILLVNLGRGVEGRDTAGLFGSLLLNALWSAVQAGAADPNHPTMLYVDEFQDLLNLPISPADMFAQARSRGLAMTVAHQDLSQLVRNREVHDAALNNARSKVVFQVEADDAYQFAKRFGRSVTDEDFKNLRQFEVIARLATGDGVSGPVSGVTLEPCEPTGLAAEVRQLSRRTYGRPAGEVEVEIRARRGMTPKPQEPKGKQRRPRFGGPRHKEGEE
ncbi:type IV secretory system conjugative DNA transfer family protein [Streptomyces cynarae]|uniref:type IV secretory system conjugative DNA transfer family protein n=1 Tax=Streptomyces cynarae TaxID=2981134 RepID=UPI00406C3ED0